MSSPAKNSLIRTSQDVELKAKEKERVYPPSPDASRRSALNSLHAVCTDITHSDDRPIVPQLPRSLESSMPDDILYDESSFQAT